MTSMYRQLVIFYVLPIQYINDFEVNFIFKAYHACVMGGLRYRNWSEELSLYNQFIFCNL